MSDAKTPVQWTPEGIKKSNSTGSAGALSTKSHDSMTVLGTHPLGSLRLTHPDEVSVSQESNNEDRDDSPPPLDRPTRKKSVRISEAAPEVLEYRRLSKPSSERLRDIPAHGMGGGDVVLILDLPEVYIIGYDAISFTAKHFGGIRDIPPGPHFFWVAHPNGGSARSGFWIESQGDDRVHVIQWDKFNEGLFEPSRAEARIQVEGIPDFHGKLIPYQEPTLVGPADFTRSRVNLDSAAALRVWAQLTGSINERVLSRLTGQQDQNWHVHTGDRVRGAILLAAEIELEQKLSTPFLQTRELNFSFSQHSKTYSAALVGADRTLAATDATTYITSMLSAPEAKLSDDDVVGEFQFAYIVGMHLGNDSCIQQWWYMLLKLVLKAYLLPEQQPILAEKLFSTLAAQLRYSSDWLDGSILDYGDSNTRDMRLALIIFKRRLEESLGSLGAAVTTDQLAVSTAFAQVESAVVALGWDLHGAYLRKGKVMMEDGEEVELEMAELQAEDERGEWAPEVVELDEHGRQTDLVSWSD